jgi:hypothetical protein
MIRHIVLFKLREFSTPDEKKKAAEIVSAELLKLKKQIHFIREFESGINITMDESAYDWALNSSFASTDDLKAYQAHPDHQAFIQFNKDYSVKKVVIDYEY